MSIQLGEKVGSGKHGVVYLNPVDKSQVVKVIKRPGDMDIDYFVHSVQNEIERQNSAAKVNIAVPVIKAVTTNDIAYIYMKRLEKTFQQKIDSMLDKGTFDRHAFTNDLTKLTELVKKLYSIGIEDSVVILENIMFDSENRMYLIDFGVEYIQRMIRYTVASSMISDLIINISDRLDNRKIFSELSRINHSASDESNIDVFVNVLEKYGLIIV